MTIHSSSRLRKEPGMIDQPAYTVISQTGRVLGTVHQKHSPVARNVSNMGGSIYWVAATPDGQIVSPHNTYRRMDAVEVLENL